MAAILAKAISRGRYFRPQSGATTIRSGATVEPVPARRAAYDADDLEIPSFLRRSR